jgi:hypothetical protein
MLTLLAPRHVMDKDDQWRAVGQPSMIQAFATAIRNATTRRDDEEHSLEYLDLTVNGEASTKMFFQLDQHLRMLGNNTLGVPVKLRHAPAAYHSTEQSEMDGPQPLVSLRIVAQNSEPCLLGSYTNTFLHAQAVSTWQAMLEHGHMCFLLIIDGFLDDALTPLSTFFTQVEAYLRSQSGATG